MTYRTGFFRSADDVHDIAYYVFMPEGEVKAAVQIVHGMNEYLLRYKHFAKFLNDNGIAVCGNDHLGHGCSVSSEDDYGYFAPEKGWQKAVIDMFKMTKIMKEKTGDVPYFMFGHSMGSFLARAYLVKFGSQLDGAVICGTGDGMPATAALLTVCDGVRLAKGERYRSKKLNDIAFGKYNERFPDAKYSTAWLSRDEEIQRAFSQDEKANHIFTVNGFENLAKMLYYISDARWYAALRKDLPIFMIAGTDDPVGNYGKGVEAVFNKMTEAGCSAKLKLYQDCRHELVNELNKEEVMGDILEFLNGCMDKAPAEEADEGEQE